ncbi:hypothetical protein D3C87_160210 [compost metagenome]
MKDNTRVYKMSFASVYPHYIQKAEKKSRTKEEVDEIIFWLTGYDKQEFQQLLNNKPILKPFLLRHHQSIQMLQELLV